MNTKLYIILFMISSMVSCNTEQVNTEEEHEHEHEEEGIVSLNKKQQESLGLKIGSFEMRNLTTVVKANGALEVSPESKASVTAIIGGNVKSIKVFQGDKVVKGQVLVVLEHPDYITLQEEFATIANNMEFLEKEYSRQKELYDNNVGAGKDYQKAKSDYLNAKVKFESLKSRLLLVNISPSEVKKGRISNTINIVSPISGYINTVSIKLGMYVDSRTELFEIADNSAIHADFMVYEKDVHLLSLGQKIHFTVSNRPDTEYTAEIFAIGTRFDQQTRAIHIHSNITGDTKGLIPGMYITGHLHTDKKYVATLSNDAIVVEGLKLYIFIVDNDEHGLEAISDTSHEGLNHEKAVSEGENEGHNHDAETENTDLVKLKMVEVITGTSDDGYTEVRLLNELPNDTKVALNSAYYLLSDLKKEETEHEH